MSDLRQARAERTVQFRKDRFGMFIHWGIYSIPARGEWVRSQERISNEEYQPFFEEFDPYEYDPKAWARLAREAGMKYAVLTTKHHDGFCLFDSKLTDYKATNTPAGRDLVREYVDAFRAEGLKIGFYYSLLDWHHPDYPAFADRHHPMRGNESVREQEKDKDFSRYLAYLHGQVRELLTNYGKIDIIWFDFSYDEMKGEKWEATKLVKMVRELQPGIIIDNRLEGSGDAVGSIKTANPAFYAGDFDGPEQIIPPEGVVDVLGDPVPWEACLTLNDNWGYTAKDHNYKTAEQVVRGIVECVSKNGNILLNVGPDARGNIPEESVAILKQVGKWMQKNGRSIYGCSRCELEKPEWGRYTQNGKYIYAHIYERGIGPTAFKGLAGKIKKARLLSDNSEIKVEKPWNAGEYSDYAFINFGSTTLPDPIDTVVELELK